MGTLLSNIKQKGIGPYLIIIIIGLLAWFPVTFLLFSLKNDALNLDLPVKYFISECIHHGISPLWMNSWALGFPLQSSINWSIFNPVQLLFYSLFRYNVYTLQWEFLSYIVAAGCGMFWLLTRQLKVATFTALLLSVAYMLSGFAVSSAQFLLFISSLAFIPFCYAGVFQYLKNPTLRNGVLMVFLFYLMMTGSYPPYVIIVSYSVIAAFLIRLLFQKKDLSPIGFKAYYRQMLGTLLPVGILLILLSAPFAYYTFEVMHYMERGAAIADSSFQHSNYLHPFALVTCLLPFTAISLEFENSSRLVQDTYFGLVALLFCIPALIRTIQKKDKQSLVFFIAAIICLLLSFDNHLPFRSWLNFLWGMNLFRGAAIFRLLFLFFILCFLAPSFSFILSYLLNIAKRKRKILLVLLLSALLLSILSFLWVVLNMKDVGNFTLVSLKYQFMDGSNLTSFLIALGMLSLIVAGLCLSLFRNSKMLFAIVFTADLALNTLLCMPFFAVSSYSPAAVTDILPFSAGFPIDNSVRTNAAVIHDSKGNPFYNSNVFKKQVTLDNFYVFPIVLKQASPFIEKLRTSVSNGNMEIPLVAFSNGTSEGDSIGINKTDPGWIEFSFQLKKGRSIRIAQNYFPGWTATINGKLIPIEQLPENGLVVNIPSGNGTVVMKYEKKFLLVAAIFLSALFYVFIIGMAISSWKKKP